MIRPCPICQSLSKDTIFHQSFGDNPVSLISEYDVVVCKSCGFTFADNIPSQKELNDYYEKLSKYEFNYRAGDVLDDYVEYYKKVVSFLEPYLPDRECAILDIGCSTGGLLAEFKSRGFLDLTGIDPAPRCALVAKERYGIEVRTGNIGALRIERKFALVILSAVLEHLADFDEAFKVIFSVLDPGGLLFIETPDAERFEFFISAPYQQFSIEHINYFSRISLRNLLAKYSFDTIDIRQSESKINMVVEPDILALARIGKNIKKEIIFDNVSRGSLINYCEKSLKIDREIRTLIEEKIFGSEKIIIWGVGTHTLRLLGSGFDASRALYFVDSNEKYIGKRLHGIEIKRPEDIREENPILISSFSYQREIEEQIRDKLKLKNEIIKLY